jgi:hypothetical protein
MYLKFSGFSIPIIVIFFGIIKVSKSYINVNVPSIGFITVGVLFIVAFTRLITIYQKAFEGSNVFNF